MVAETRVSWTLLLLITLGCCWDQSELLGSCRVGKMCCVFQCFFVEVDEPKSGNDWCLWWSKVCQKTSNLQSFQDLKSLVKKQISKKTYHKNSSNSLKLKILPIRCLKKTNPSNFDITAIGLVQVSLSRSDVWVEASRICRLWPSWS